MFIDATKDGDIYVKEYESDSRHNALLLGFGPTGPSIKITSQQGADLLSTLLRLYDVVQS